MSWLREYVTRYQGLLVGGLVSLALGAAIFAIVLTFTGRQNATDKTARVAAGKVVIAKKKADTAVAAAARTKKIAVRARRGQQAQLRFLQGKQGLPGVRGANGKLGAPGPTGPAGPPGRAPTKAEVAAAVAAYCAGDVCKPPGVTRDDVLAAVTAYCAVRTCRGPAGADGKDGAAGKNGTDGAAGQDGAPPPQSFRLVYGDFIADCAQTDTASRTYTCTSPAP